MVVAECRSTGVTPSAVIHLCWVIQRRHSVGNILIAGPLPMASCGERQLKTHFGSALSAFNRAIFGLFHVCRSRSMTALTAHINLVVGGCVRPCRGVITFNHVGAMTFSAATVPVVVNAGPMKGAFISNRLFIFVYMVPALTTFRSFTGIPCNA